jgi:alkanesulfonate monooxygenase SsuD/methylene tetrahydromethanopterin reductase-like flavin-dependent oxidoreductase (luciferase family)
VADGTILSEPSSVGYVRWAGEQIAATRPHRLTAYSWFSMDADGAAARAALRPLLAERVHEGGPQFEHAGAPELTDRWIAELTVSGTPEECATAIAALGDAGADSVVLVPPRPGSDPALIARELLPLLA